MLSKTAARGVWFGMVMALMGPVSDAQSVMISVFNDAKVPPGTLASAESNASRIFRQAGLETSWVDCGEGSSASQWKEPCTEAEFPTHLHVRILARARTLAGSILGTSYLDEDGAGCYSEVFFEAVTSLHLKSGPALDITLGHVMAHEIAHLLLGSNSHSTMGIMRGQWQTEELRAAAKGALLFTSVEAKAMREKVLASTATSGRVARNDEPAQQHAAAAASFSSGPKARTFRSPL